MNIAAGIQKTHGKCRALVLELGWNDTYRELHCPAVMHLLDLPPELLDNIAAHLDCRKDILSLALCCHCLHSLVSHTHLQYRDIRCRLGLSALWDRLASDDLHAGLLRSLTILPDNVFDIQSVIRDNLLLEERVPDEYQECASDEATVASGREREERLVRALKRAPNLRRFRWFGDPGGNNIWETLSALGTVQELHVLDLEREQPPWVSPERAIGTSHSFLSFRGLISFNLRANAFDKEQAVPNAMPLLRMLIDNCTDLQSLTLHLEMYGHMQTVSADPLLCHAGWPDLRNLYLEGFHCTSSTLSPFLASHPFLRDVHLPRMMPGYLWANVVLPDGALPNLRLLECSSHTAAALLRNPRAANGLTSLRGVDLEDELIVDMYFNYASDDEWWDGHADDDHDFETRTGSPWRAQLVEGIRLHPSITSVWLETESSYVPTAHVMELATAAPQITELSLPHNPPTPLVSTTTRFDARIVNSLPIPFSS
ncbi:hypothetical protein OE88DRAFT_809547 [Heliocybe sulcata]|uniref:F-box domain-containing protein n=1 Tax=Heliocybe sulcata TaxID=5364 RepID=A0A5C3MQ97_9AGAM|nr:hypothetical protein OE88DRAFT_809547 [Heliocybe sulcata]